MLSNHFRRSGGRRPWRALAAGCVLTVTASLLAASPAQAFATNARVDLKVLVFTDGSAGIGVVTAELDREGARYDSIDLRNPNRPALTASTLSDTVNGSPRAKYDGVVLPNENALPAPELAVLAAFEGTFGVRQIDAYTAPTASVGLAMTWSGVMDGGSLAVSDAGKSAGFGYLAGPVPIDNLSPTVDETYGYTGTPQPGVTYTALVNATAPASGPVIGVYTHPAQGTVPAHDELVVTLAMNQYQPVAQELGHGLVTWVTQGIHLGYWRNWFSVDVDDVFLPDDRWDAANNCTSGDGCAASVTPLNPIRMTATDVTTLEQWQTKQGVKLEMTFNGEGSVDAGTSDPLTTKLVTDRAQFRWLNHTYSHTYLGCVQDFTVTPWRCQTDASGNTIWVSKADIQSQISDNLTWARGKGISVNANELVTGEHSGLVALPQVTQDNPSLAPALSATGVTVIASDASRESTPRAVGAAVTVPRHPMNIFYNVSTQADEVDEYNWLYTSTADGGSGICENNPTSTCIAPLSAPDGFSSYIVPVESAIMFGHVVSGDPEPHYVHQSNLTGDGIAYPVLSSVLNRYKATYTSTAPVLNPRLTEVSVQQSRRAAWAAGNGSVEAYVQNGHVTVINHANGALTVPLTVPTGTRTTTISLLGLEVLGGNYGTSYGPENSDWTTLGAGAQLLRRLPG